MLVSKLKTTRPARSAPLTDSRMIVEKDRPSRLPSGEIIVGPWVVDPAKDRHLRDAVTPGGWLKGGDWELVLLCRTTCPAWRRTL